MTGTHVHHPPCQTPERETDTHTHTHIVRTFPTPDPTCCCSSWSAVHAGNGPRSEQPSIMLCYVQLACLPGLPPPLLSVSSGCRVWSGLPPLPPNVCNRAGGGRLCVCARTHTPPPSTPRAYHAAHNMGLLKGNSDALLPSPFPARGFLLLFLFILFPLPGYPSRESFPSSPRRCCVCPFLSLPFSSAADPLHSFDRPTGLAWLLTLFFPSFFSRAHFRCQRCNLGLVWSGLLPTLLFLNPPFVRSATATDARFCSVESSDRTSPRAQQHRRRRRHYILEAASPACSSCEQPHFRPGLREDPPPHLLGHPHPHPPRDIQHHTPTMMSPTLQMTAPAPYTPTSDAMDRHDYGVSKNRKAASTGGGRAWSEDEVRPMLFPFLLHLVPRRCRAEKGWR